MSDSMLDTTVYRFRTAVGGFHKGDVAAYITKTAASHRAELEQQNERIAALEAENESLRSQLMASMLSDETPQSPAPLPEPEDISSLELAAYRRAEAAERLANLRAQKLYESLEAICQDTEGEFTAANAAVQQTMETILGQARHLEEACRTLSQSLNLSREKLSSMDAMIPDPAEDLEAELCGN